MSEAAAELLGYPVCFHLPFKVVIHDLDIKGALVSAFYLTPVLGVPSVVMFTNLR